MIPSQTSIRPRRKPPLPVRPGQTPRYDIAAEGERSPVVAPVVTPALLAPVADAGEGLPADFLRIPNTQAAPPVMSGAADVMSAPPTPRRVRIDALQDRVTTLRNTPAQDKNGRWKSIGLNLLHGLGEGANAVTQASMRSGRPVDAYGVAQVVGGGIGSGIAGGANPALDEQRKNDRFIGNLDRQLKEQLTYEKIEDERMERERKFKHEQTDQELKRMQITQTGDAARMRSGDAQTRSLVSMFNRLPSFDPQDAGNVEIVEAMRGAGLPVFAKHANQKLEIKVDPRTGSWRVFSADPQTGEATSGVITDRATDAPVVTATREQMSAETAAANRQAQDTRAATNIRSRENVAAANRESQERRAATSGVRARGGGANPTDARRTRAATAIGKLNTLLGKFETARTDKVRNAARRQIERQSSLINSEFGDLTDDDASGWRTSLKPRATSSLPTTGGGAYAGRRFALGNLGAIRQRLGVASDEEARRLVEAQGGTFQ